MSGSNGYNGTLEAREARYDRLAKEQPGKYLPLVKEPIPLVQEPPAVNSRAGLKAYSSLELAKLKIIQADIKAGKAGPGEVGVAQDILLKHHEKLGHSGTSHDGKDNIAGKLTNAAIKKALTTGPA